jgi:hypothetical protein
MNLYYWILEVHTKMSITYNIIFQHPVALIYSLHSIITVFNTTFSTSVFTLVLHVSATLGHHQALLLLLLKLSHCNLAFLYMRTYSFVLKEDKSETKLQANE